MKSFRILVACGVVTAVVASGWNGDAAPAFAQAPAGSLEKQAKPITPENPIPRRVSYEPPQYPAEALAAGARGSVTMMVTLDDGGSVAEARVTRTSLRLTNPVVSMTLTGTSESDESKFLVNQGPDQANAVRAVVKVLRDAAVQSVQRWRYDPPASAPIAFPVIVNFAPPGSEGEEGNTAGAAGAGTAVGGQAPLRVGGNIKAPTKIKHVAPEYPEEARAAGISGMVILEATIGADGRVTNARILRSIPLLDEAAVDAVMQWEFTPTLLNGVAVPVIMTVTVNFTLG